MFEANDEPSANDNTLNEDHQTGGSSSHTGLWLGIIGVVAGYLLAVGVFLVADGLFEMLGRFGISVSSWLVPYITGIFVLFPTLGLSGVLIARKKPRAGAYFLIRRVSWRRLPVFRSV